MWRRTGRQAADALRAMIHAANTAGIGWRIHRYTTMASRM
jgi:hypothetical protein